MASVEFNRRLTETMASRAGCPALTAGSAVVQALRAVGAEKIGLADPFPKPFLTQIVRDHLQHPEVGFKVVKEATARGANPHVITNLSPTVAYRIGREADHPEADTILLSANVWRTLEIIEPLERNLGKPVIAANQATVWAALKMIGVAPEPVLWITVQSQLAPFKIAEEIMNPPWAFEIYPGPGQQGCFSFSCSFSLGAAPGHRSQSSLWRKAIWRTPLQDITELDDPWLRIKQVSKWTGDLDGMIERDFHPCADALQPDTLLSGRRSGPRIDGRGAPGPWKSI